MQRYVYVLVRIPRQPREVLQTEMSSVSRDLLKELECPVCLRYMNPPILLCSSGHSICQNCRQKVSVCPTCRCSFITYRSIALENIVRALEYPCFNYLQGCNEILPLHLINEHEVVCPIGIHTCPMNKFPEVNCTWEGLWTEFRNHVNERHIKNHAVIEEPHFQSEAINTVMPIIFTLDEIFLYYKAKQNKKWYFAIMMVGTNSRSSKYKAVYSLQAANGVDSIVKTVTMSSFTEEFNDIFKSYRCLSLSDEEVNLYISNKKLNLSVEISEIGNST